MSTPQSYLVWAPPPALVSPRRGDPQRWISVAALALGVVVCAVFAAQAVWHQVYFESTSDAVYTAWVYRPEIYGYLVAAAVCQLGAGLMVIPSLGLTPRLLIVAVVAAVSVSSASTGVATAHGRLHVDPALRAGIAAIQVPGAVAGVVAPSDPRPLRIGDTLPAPGYTQVWTVSEPTGESACSAATAASGAGWSSQGDACGLVRVVGLVREYMFTREETDGSWSVVVQVEPAYS